MASKRRVRPTFLRATIALIAGAAPWVSGAEPVSFNRDVRPILAANCFACHGPDAAARQAELRLDTPEGAVADLGGRQAIRSGVPESSELIRRITSVDPDERMPPDDSNKKLTEHQIELLRRWIREGGVYEPHWAFVAPQRLAVPDVAAALSRLPPDVTPDPGQYAAWARSPLDQFVLASMAREGLVPTPEADRYTLIRRLYLDLIGLLPTVEEADQFVQDSDPLAYERLVDRLLQSPHYGERWARKWLDLARYADTNGYEKDRPRSIWPYRDWVIRALNNDLPFNQFTIHQLAGDMLPARTEEQWIATGFHRNTMLNEEGGIDPLEFRFHAMTDRVGTTTTTWLALTMNCCQCHTHKYDPIAHEDYYRLMALLNNADEPDLDLVSPADEELRRSRLAESQRLLDELPSRWPVNTAGDMSREASAAAPRELAEQAFSEWLQRERKRTVKWAPMRPADMRSNMPLLTLQPDDSVFASGDSTKDDTFELVFHDVPEGVTAIRLEAIPDERLPAHGPGMTYYEGPKGDFFLGEFQLFSNGCQLTVSRASESYAKNNFGSHPVSAALATDGDPQTGWSCAGRFGEAHQAVFVLREPFSGASADRAEGTSELKVTMRFGRHYACSLGRFRISATTDPNPADARDLSPELESLLVLSDESMSAEQRRRLWEHFLLTAPELASETKKIHELRQPLEGTTTLVFRERPPENPRPTYRHHRGEYLQPKERVTAGVPSFLPALPSDAVPNRLTFARWLTSPDHPLTARVVVNRHWAAFFGQGIVRTLADFGYQGESPTHPELLDWLAIEFVSRGWSLKQLHRLIVTSATYRQSAELSSARSAQDSQNRWLSRGPRFRIDAELIRDVQLDVSGLLSRRMFGPPVRPPQPAGVTEVAYGGGSWHVSTGEDRYRRGVYTFIKRTAPYAMFQTFDAPSGEYCVAHRESSNTPLQSLTLLNDETFVEAAQNLGAAVAGLSKNDRERVEAMFRRCLTRPPTGTEIEKMAAFVQLQRARIARGDLDAAEIAGGAGKSAASAGSVECAVWTILARALLNLDEMITRQ